MRRDMRQTVREAGVWVNLNPSSPDKLAENCILIADLLNKGWVIDRTEPASRNTFRAHLHLWKQKEARPNG